MASSSTSQTTSHVASQANTVVAEIPRIDAEVALLEAHPLDVWQYCLHCHIGGHLNWNTGHRWENCIEQIPVNLLGPDRENLDWLKKIPRNTRTEGLIDMGRQLGSLQDQKTDYQLHVNRRDRRLLKMYRAMVDSQASFDHEVWFRAMSAYNVLVETFVQRCIGEVEMIMDLQIDDYHREYISPLDFLYHISSSERTFSRYLRTHSSFDITNDMIESRLNSIKKDFEEILAKWEVIIQGYLDRDRSLRHLGRADAEWMRKAFKVMREMQPWLDLHPAHGVWWVYPSRREVFLREDFEIPETEDNEEIDGSEEEESEEEESEGEMSELE